MNFIWMVMRMNYVIIFRLKDLFGEGAAKVFFAGINLVRMTILDIKAP